MTSFVLNDIKSIAINQSQTLCVSLRKLYILNTKCKILSKSNKRISVLKG